MPLDCMDRNMPSNHQSLCTDIFAVHGGSLIAFNVLDLANAGMNGIGSMAMRQQNPTGKAPQQMFLHVFKASGAAGARDGIRVE